MTLSIIALQISNSFDALSAVESGLASSLAMLVVIYMGRAIHMTRMDLLWTLGTMISPRATKPRIYLTGLLVHLMMGAAFGLAHAGLLTQLDPSTNAGANGLGLVLGLGHGMVAGLIMPLMLTMAHPLVRNQEIPSPGFALSGFGSLTYVGVIMAHGVFGLVLGATYINLIS